jgi:hypothetical protein
MLIVLKRCVTSTIVLIVFVFCWALLNRDRDYGIGSNFWKFNLIRICYTLGESVSLVKVFRLFRLEGIFLVFRG